MNIHITHVLHISLSMWFFSLMDAEKFLGPLCIWKLSALLQRGWHRQSLNLTRKSVRSNDNKKATRPALQVYAIISLYFSVRIIINSAGPPRDPGPLQQVVCINQGDSGLHLSQLYLRWENLFNFFFNSLIILIFFFFRLVLLDNHRNCGKAAGGSSPSGRVYGACATWRSPRVLDRRRLADRLCGRLTQHSSSQPKFLLHSLQVERTTGTTYCSSINLLSK